MSLVDGLVADVMAPAANWMQLVGLTATLKDDKDAENAAIAGVNVMKAFQSEGKHVLVEIENNDVTNRVVDFQNHKKSDCQSFDMILTALHGKEVNLDKVICEGYPLSAKGQQDEEFCKDQLALARNGLNKVSAKRALSEDERITVNVDQDGTIGEREQQISGDFRQTYEGWCAWSLARQSNGALVTSSVPVPP